MRSDLTFFFTVFLSLAKSFFLFFKVNQEKENTIVCIHYYYSTKTK